RAELAEARDPRRAVPAATRGLGRSLGPAGGPGPDVDGRSARNHRGAGAAALIADTGPARGRGRGSGPRGVFLGLSRSWVLRRTTVFESGSPPMCGRSSCPSVGDTS